MEIVKASQNATTGDLRRRLLRVAQGVVFDIWMVHYTISSETTFTSADDLSMALSIRAQDQVDDAQNVDMAIQASDKQIFLKVPLIAAFLTSGADTLLGAHTISLPRPLTVPYLAGLFHQQTTGSVQVGIEVYFERRVASKMEMAHLVLSAGGRARTNPE